MNKKAVWTDVQQTLSVNNRNSKSDQAFYLGLGLGVAVMLAGSLAVAGHEPLCREPWEIESTTAVFPLSDSAR